MTKEDFMKQVRADMKAKKVKKAKEKIYKKDIGTDLRFRKFKRTKIKQVKFHEFEYQNSIKLVEILGISFNDIISDFVSSKLEELGEVPKKLSDYEK